MRTGEKRKHFLTVMLLCFLALLFVPNESVLAAETYTFERENRGDLEFVVRYEGSAPTVTIESPSGEIVTEFAKTEQGNTTLYYYLKDAERGEWSVTTSKAAKVFAYDWEPELWIESFTADAAENDRITAHATVTSESDLRFDWYLYAVRVDENGGFSERYLLAQTSGQTNRENETTVDLKDVPDGDDYRLFMEAVVTMNDSETEDTALAGQTFSVSGHTKDGDFSELKSTLDLTNGVLTLDWSELTAEYERMAVRVTQNGELLSDEEHASEVNTVRVLLDPANGDLEVTLLPLDRDGRFETRYTGTISLDPGVTVQIETEEQTGAWMAKISYAVGENTVESEVTVGTESYDFRFTGEGEVSVPLPSMETSDVAVRFEAMPNRWYQIEKEIAVNTLPPELTLYGLSDGMKVAEKKLVIPGRTDSGATLTLNEEPREVAENGSFSFTEELSSGENILVFSSEGTNGVRTTRTIRVTYAPGGKVRETGDTVKTKALPILLLILAIGVAVLFTLLAFQIGKKKGKSTARRTLAAIRTALIFGILYGALFIAFCIYRAALISGEIRGDALISLLVDSSYAKIGEALTERESWISRSRFGVLSLVIFVGAFVLTILLRAAVERIQRSREERSARREQSAETRENVQPQEAAESSVGIEPLQVPEKPPTETELLQVPEEPPAETESLQAPAPDFKFCAECGAKIPLQAEFCPMCGTKVE